MILVAGVAFLLGCAAGLAISALVDLHTLHRGRSRVYDLPRSDIGIDVQHRTSDTLP